MTSPNGDVGAYKPSFFYKLGLGLEELEQVTFDSPKPEPHELYPKTFKAPAPPRDYARPSTTPNPRSHLGAVNPKAAHLLVPFVASVFKKGSRSLKRNASKSRSRSVCLHHIMCTATRLSYTQDLSQLTDSADFGNH